MLRFVLSPRWIGLLVVVVVLGFTCVKLSQWQFHRYAERKDHNTAVRANLNATPVLVGSVLSTDAEPDSADEWRRVTAKGRYDAAHQIAVLYRTKSGTPGIDVVTPLVTEEGPAVLVDRGWIQTSGNGNVTPKLPAPTAGQVTVEGWVRVDSDGDASQVVPSQGSVRAISADAVGAELPYPLYDGFLELTKETPASPHAPAKADEPDLSGGPSFFYGFQWLFFALLFFAFWCYFAWAEYQEQVKGRPRGRNSVTAPAPGRTPAKESVSTTQVPDRGDGGNDL